MIEWVPRGQTVKQQYYIEVLRKSEEKAREICRTTRGFCTKTTPRCKKLCKRVLDGQAHYCNRASTVLTRSQAIRFLPIS
ncbi:hypothetical protein TNCV_2061881 [Trichonephila clavipes]|nr:hypothetical protein TNCV_2061881 [Trichonephila clavipes]